MKKVYHFRIADFGVELHMPEGARIDGLLPSFRPFRCGPDAVSGEPLFRLEVLAPGSTLPEGGEWNLLEDSANDLGHVRLLRNAGGYKAEIGFASANGLHCLYADLAFSEAKATLCWESSRAGHALCSMLRILFSQAVLRHGGISLHASAVALNGKAYLFMGRSGTGKSTHSALWLSHFPGAELLNDDNPVVRVIHGQAVAYGSPWSGKTHCYKNLSFPVGGIVRLAQAKTNRFALRQEVDAFITLLPGCSAVHKDAGLQASLHTALIALAAAVPVGVLECLPNPEAAMLCAECLERAGQEKTRAGNPEPNE